MQFVLDACSHKGKLLDFCVIFTLYILYNLLNTVHYVCQPNSFPLFFHLKSDFKTSWIVYQYTKPKSVIINLFYSLFKMRSAKHYSQLTNGNEEKTFLRVAIGQSAAIFHTSYSG